MNSLFQQKQRELVVAVSKVEELSRQLEILKTGKMDPFNNNQSSVAELDCLYKELQVKYMELLILFSNEVVVFQHSRLLVRCTFLKMGQRKMYSICCFSPAPLLDDLDVEVLLYWLFLSIVVSILSELK